MGKNKAQAANGGSRKLNDIRPLAAATLIGIVVLIGWAVISYFEEPIVSTYRELTTSKKVEAVPVKTIKVTEEIPTLVIDRDLRESDFPKAIEIEEDPDILESEKPLAVVKGETVPEAAVDNLIEEVMAEIPDNDEENWPDYIPVETFCVVQAPVLNDEVTRLAAKLGCDVTKLKYLKGINICSAHTGECAPY